MTDFERELKKLNELIDRIKASPVNKNTSLIKNRNSYIRIKSCSNIEVFENFLENSCFTFRDTSIPNKLLLKLSDHQLERLNNLRLRQNQLTNGELNEAYSLLHSQNFTERTAFSQYQIQQPTQPQISQNNQGFAQYKISLSQLQQQKSPRPQAPKVKQELAQHQNSLSQSMQQPPQPQQILDQCKHYTIYQDGTLVFSKGYGRKIKNNAFANNQNIKKVICSDDIKIIGKSAFEKCENLTSAEAQNVTGICDDAFSDCKSLVQIKFPSVKTIESNAFARSGLLDIKQTDLPNVKNIEEEAFSGCKDLTTFYFPELETIEDSAFKNCKQLTYINIPNIKKSKMMLLFIANQYPKSIQAA